MKDTGRLVRMRSSRGSRPSAKELEERLAQSAEIWGARWNDPIALLLRVFDLLEDAREERRGLV